MEIKTKINKWYLIKLKLLYNKRNQKKKKRERTLRRREKSLQTKQPTGINLQTTQTANSAQYQKPKNPIKWTEDQNTQFSKEEI